MGREYRQGMSLTLGTGPLAGTPGGDFNFDLAGAAPKHRIYFEPFAPRLRAIVGDRVVLDSVRAHLLHETGIAPQAYVPLEDLDGSLLARTDTTTHCPFKGDASYWTVGGIENVAWSYEDPKAEVDAIRGHLAFYPDRVTVGIES